MDDIDTPPEPVSVDKGEFLVVERHAVDAGHVKRDGWKFAAAKAMHRWPIGQQMHRKDYDEAVSAACTHVIR